MMDPSFTFFYQFAVEALSPADGTWKGLGFSRAARANFEGLAGLKPRFELSLGWLTLLPTQNWSHSLPIRAFSDQPKRSEMDPKQRQESMQAFNQIFQRAQEEAAKEMAGKVSLEKDREAFLQERNAATERAFRRHGLTRDLASFSLLVGDSLPHTLRAGDALEFARSGNGDFHYNVVRNAEAIFSAGFVGNSDPGGPMAVWQEKHQRNYVTARINEQRFELRDGQEAHSDPYYVFLARSNAKVPPIAFEFTPRAVYAAGRLDCLTQVQIADAALKLTSPEMILL